MAIRHDKYQLRQNKTVKPRTVKLTLPYYYLQAAAMFAHDVCLIQINRKIYVNNVLINITGAAAISATKL